MILSAPENVIMNKSKSGLPLVARRINPTKVIGRGSSDLSFLRVLGLSFVKLLSKVVRSSDMSTVRGGPCENTGVIVIYGRMRTWAPEGMDDGGD